MLRNDQKEKYDTMYKEYVLDRYNSWEKIICNQIIGRNRCIQPVIINGHLLCDKPDFNRLYAAELRLPIGMNPYTIKVNPQKVEVQQMPQPKKGGKQNALTAGIQKQLTKKFASDTSKNKKELIHRLWDRNQIEELGFQNKKFEN